MEYDADFAAADTPAEQGAVIMRWVERLKYVFPPDLRSQIIASGQTMIARQYWCKIFDEQDEAREAETALSRAGSGHPVVTATTDEDREFRRTRGAPPSIGLYCAAERTVYIAPAHWSDPWTLAHEIGHHRMTLRQGGRHSEAMADEAGRRIVQRLLRQYPFPQIVIPLLADEIDTNLPAPERSTTQRRARTRRARR